METQNILTVSLKEYKRTLDDLRASLAQAEKGTAEYNKRADEIRETQQRLNEAMAVGKEKAAAVAGSYNDLAAQLSNAKKELKNIATGTTEWEEQAAKVNDLTDKLKGLDAEMGVYTRNVGNYAIAGQSMKSQLRETREEIAQLLAQGIAPTDERMQQLVETAGKLDDAMGDAAAMIKAAANDTNTLATMVDVAKTGTAVFGVWQGAMAAFGIENDKVAQSIQKVQGILTMLNSIQTIQTALVDKSSATYRLWNKLLGTNTVETAKNAAAQQANTATQKANTAERIANANATEKQTNATQVATKATKGWAVALKGLGLGIVIALVSKAYSEIMKARGAFEEMSKTNDKYRHSINETATELQLYVRKIDLYKGSAKQEKELVDELNGKYGDTLGYYKSLDEWKKALIASTEKYCELLVYEAQLQDAVQKKIEAEDALDKARAKADSMQNRANSVNGMNTMGSSIAGMSLTQASAGYANATAMSASSDLKKAEAAADAANKKVDDLLNKIADLKKDLNQGGSKPGGGSGGGGSKGGKKDLLEGLTAQAEALLLAYRNVEEENRKVLEMKRASGGLTEGDELSAQEAAYTRQKQVFEGLITLYSTELTKYKEGSEEHKRISAELSKYQEELTKATNNIIITKEKEKFAKIKEEREKSTSDYKKDLEEQKKATDTTINNIEWKYDELLSKIDSGDPHSGSKQIKLEIAKENEIFEATQNGLQKRLGETERYYDEQIRLAEGNEELKKTLIAEKEQAINDIQAEIEDNRLAHSRKISAAMAKLSEAQKKERKAIIEEHVKSAAALSSSLGSLMGTIGDIMQENLQRRIDNKEIEEDLAEQEFERVKKVQIAQTVLSTIAGAVGAFMQDKKSFPSPWNYIIAGVDMASTLAVGAAQIAQIKSQTFDGASGGNVGGGSGQGIPDIQVNPLLDENADLQTMTSLNTEVTSNKIDNQRVYIQQADITKSGKQVEIRQADTTF